MCIYIYIYIIHIHIHIHIYIYIERERESAPFSRRMRRSRAAETVAQYFRHATACPGAAACDVASARRGDLCC